MKSLHVFSSFLPYGTPQTLRRYSFIQGRIIVELVHKQSSPLLEGSFPFFLHVLIVHSCSTILLFSCPPPSPVQCVPENTVRSPKPEVDICRRTATSWNLFPHSGLAWTWRPSYETTSTLTTWPSPAPSIVYGQTLTTLSNLFSNLVCDFTVTSTSPLFIHTFRKFITSNVLDPPVAYIPYSLSLFRFHRKYRGTNLLNYEESSPRRNYFSTYVLQLKP